MRDNKQTIDVKNNLGNIFANTFDIKDLKIDNQLSEAKFSNFTLDDYDEKKYTLPEKTVELVNTVKKEKFFVLGGDGYEKDELYKHIAWKIFKEIPGISKTAKIWINSANYQSFDLYINEEKEPTIFILRDVSPQNINNDLARLYKTVRDNSHYLIISTNTDIKKWKLEGEVSRLFWQPESNESLYDCKDLQEILLEKLTEVNQTLPEGLRSREFKTSSVLMGDLLLTNVARELKSPQSIDSFVDRLINFEKDLANRLVSDEKSVITVADIRVIIEECQDDKRSLRHWYDVSLSPREKLIALGLCLFNGFYDDQFFAAMDVLVEQSWHKRESSLEGLDYCDLESQSPYYSLKSLGQNGIKRVESNSQKLSEYFLGIVWDSHRRQILSALPVMESLVKDSVLPGFGNRELYGTTQRCRVLRTEISETLCCIGLKSEDSIEGTVLEGTLLSLASEEDIEVQEVVARAIARWRNYGQDEKLFETIQRWQDQATVWDMLKSFWNDNDTEKQNRDRETPEIYIKATVALTVGFAAQYYLPNEMNDKLCHLLKQLAADTTNDFILRRFSEYTLPRVVSLHVNQLRDILKEMTRYLSLNDAIGKSLAIAYEVNSLEVVEILDAWFDEYKRNRPTHFSENEITHPEKILAVAVIAYGWMQYKENRGPLTIDDGFKRLKTILRKEMSEYVRWAAIYAIILQVLNNFERAEGNIKTLFAVMHKSEIEAFVAQLVMIHLGQRQEFKKGDASFEWREKYYKVWVHREQPLTLIEKVIEKWMKDNDDEITRQIAIKFNFSRDLVDFQQKEERFIKKKKRELKDFEEQKERNKRVYSAPTFETTSEGETFSTFIVSWLATLKKRENLGIIQGLLPEILKQNIQNQDILDFVLKRMHKSMDDEIKTIAEQLETALSITKKKGIIISFIILFVAAVVFLLIM
ncbi:MAG: hypothetical protein PVH61_20685 [Candidatus Aminicenantes bacterium]|jgi:hypothetical protein